MGYRQLYSVACLTALLYIVAILSCKVQPKVTTTSKVNKTPINQNFHTDGNGIRDIVAAKINQQPVFYISELDGAVSCYTIDGKKLWNNNTTNKAVLFEINAFDIDEDGKEELVGASGDGHIYCWNSDGQLRWTFNPGYKVRFSEIAILKTDKVQIFAGGNDYQLYEIDGNGALLSKTKINGVVRSIAAGDFLVDGEPSVFLMTYSHDKFRWEFMGFINPTDKSIQKEVKYKKKKFPDLGKLMLTDLSVADIDKDNRADLLFFGDNKFKGAFIGLNGEFQKIASFQAGKKHIQRYAHGVGLSLLPHKDEIILQHGGISFLLNLKGELIQQSGERYGNQVYRDMTFEPITQQVVRAGKVGGGNGVYQYDLTKTDGLSKAPTRIGRMKEVEENVNKLYQQTLNFKMPTYQQLANKPWLMVTSFKESLEVKKIKGNELKYIAQHTWAEVIDRKEIAAVIGENEANKVDKRKKYNQTRVEMVAKAIEYEETGHAFILWAGHGTDPFYISIETIEEVLAVAPTTCHGFVYAEMHGSEDPRATYFIDYYMPRIAKAIRKNNIAKVYFRNKNMFWAATSHLGKWKDVFFSKKYKDFVVPASEDTSSRTQDVNFSGRVGMFAGDYVDDICMRLVDDNPTSWRPLSPCGQTSISPYLRNGVMLAAYGARTGIIINNNFVEQPHLNVLFALMKSGVLPMVEKEDIASIGSWHLMENIDKPLIHSIDDHHKIKQYKKGDDKAVFSVAQMHWAGASVPDYDYSKLLGVDYRWSNYLPSMPYGMIPVAPIDSKNELAKNNIPFSVSNGKQGIVDGTKVAAPKFGETMKNTATSGAKTLPVLVSGASWSAIRLDDKHIRLILVDPGYLNPQERKVTITFQGKMPNSAIDILTKEKITISKSISTLVVPAGTMRFIDLAY